MPAEIYKEALISEEREYLTDPVFKDSSAARKLIHAAYF